MIGLIKLLIWADSRVLPASLLWCFVAAANKNLGRRCLRHLAYARTWPIFGNQPHTRLSDSQRSDNSAKTLQSGKKLFFVIVDAIYASPIHPDSLSRHPSRVQHWPFDASQPHLKHTHLQVIKVQHLGSTSHLPRAADGTFGASEMAP